MNIEIGKVYKQRYRNTPNAFIGKDKAGRTIKGHGIHRPSIVFYSDDKVFYLSAKTVSDDNYEDSRNDPFNLVFEDKDLYGEDRKIAINCSVINVIDRKLFESLYIPDHPKNNYPTSVEQYNDIMITLFVLKDKIKYFEVDYIDQESKEPVWKSKSQTQASKDESEMIIKGYHHLITKTNIIPEILFNHPDHFYEVVKNCFYIEKYGVRDKLDEYLYTKSSMFNVDWEEITNEARQKIIQMQNQRQEEIEEKFKQQELAKQQKHNNWLEKHKSKKTITNSTRISNSSSR